MDIVMKPTAVMSATHRQVQTLMPFAMTVLKGKVGLHPMEKGLRTV
jgi:hypothetical protein